jgi:membrane-associated phospholipid phosphatase
MHTHRLLALVCAVAAAPAQDIVLDWNAAALNAIRTASTPPPPASRNLAILHVAIHDAVSGLGQRYDTWMRHAGAPRNASPEAAATTAAHGVMVALYASQSATFDALNATILAGIADGERKTRGIAWGTQVAREVLAARADDGSGNTAPYLGSNEPGRWRPHVSFGGIVRPALLPLWGRVVPFGLRSGRQFRPEAPPPLRSLHWAFDTLHVQLLGERSSPFRTADQTEVARFWGYGPATATPPGHWNQVAQVVAAARSRSLADQAQAFALLNIALADAAIVSWDCKYEFGLWRPITAIPLADQDGNPFTFPDPNWQPLLETPPFPEYTSGHSTFSGAAAAVLGDLYGDRTGFTVGSDDLPGVRRSYRSFTEAAWESGLSRIYGGIHYMSANVNGLITGWQTGRYVTDNLLRRRR